MGAMAQPESKPANDELRHVARFRIALRHFERRTTSVLVECRLTPQRYLLFLVIEAQAMDGEATVARLAHDLEMPRTTVSDLVARATGAGLLQRRQAERDARASRLTLTAEGRPRLQAAVAALRIDRSALRSTLVDLSRLV